MTSNFTMCLFCSKTGEFQCFEVCCPKTSSCASKLLYVQCKAVKPQGLCQVSLGLKEVQMGAHDFKLNKVPLFFSKISEYQCFLVCCPETSSCASKSLLLRCKLVKPQCLCQVSLGLKEVQMGAHDFKVKKVPFPTLKKVNINVSRSAAPELALVPASRYNCYVK